MKGYFYDLDEWLKNIEHRRRETSSEGAQWWLSRIKARSSS